MSYMSVQGSKHDGFIKKQRNIEKTHNMLICMTLTVGPVRIAGYIHTYMYTVYTYKLISIWPYVYTIYTCVHVHIYIYTVYTHVYIYTCMYMYTYVYMYIYACTCIHKHTFIWSLAISSLSRLAASPTTDCLPGLAGDLERRSSSFAHKPIFVRALLGYVKARDYM